MEAAFFVLFGKSLVYHFGTRSRHLVVLSALYHTNVTYGLLCRYHCLPSMKICRRKVVHAQNVFSGTESKRK